MVYQLHHNTMPWSKSTKNLGPGNDEISSGIGKLGCSHTDQWIILEYENNKENIKKIVLNIVKPLDTVDRYRRLMQERIKAVQWIFREDTTDLPNRNVGMRNRLGMNKNTLKTPLETIEVTS